MRGRGRAEARAVRLALLVGWLVACAGVAGARTLSDELSLLITDNSYLFQGANFDSLTPGLERIAVQGTDLPATSTIPGVTYVFDPETGTPVRSSGSLGPVFLEDADTVGRGRLLVGGAYQHADLTELDGEAASERLFFVNSAVGVDTATGHAVRVVNRFTFDDFAIRLDGGSLSATYGVTDALDVNLLLPLLHTQLDVRATTQNFTHDLVDGTVVRDPARHLALHDGAFGVGDLLLRSKYGLGRHVGLDAALGLVVRCPSGEAGNFQGLGDWTVTPLLVLSRGFGRNDVHANLGVQVDADDLQRTRVRYGVGVAVQPLERLAVLLDLIGSSGVANDTFSQDGVALGGSRFDGPFQTETAIARGSTAVPSPLHFSLVVPRTDILDIAVGLKTNVVPHLVAFVTAIVPITSDGLRADVIPAAGVEYTF